MKTPTKYNNLIEQVAEAEVANRSPSMQSLMEKVMSEQTSYPSPGNLRIIEGYPGAICSLAIFLDDHRKPICAPIDPLVISFYEYTPADEEDAARRSKNPQLRDGLEIRGPLQLVHGDAKSMDMISRAQLVAIQMLMGNNSTWWPVTDYSAEEIEEVFGALELNVIYWNDCPVGIAHMDYTELEEKAAVKVVFIGLDPNVQGKGLGREVLHEVMSRAIDRGAKTIFLDTVAHRDLRSRTSGGEVAQSNRNPSAHDVYLKSGFKMIGAKLIDPANKQQLEEEELSVNQLNGPLECAVSDLRPLRNAMHVAFNTPPNVRISE